MTTSPHDALIKIRHQIRLAENYLSENPDWIAPRAVLDSLRLREQLLANQIQVEIFSTAISELNQEKP